MEIVPVLAAVFGFWKAAQLIVGYVEEQVLLESQRSALRERFENWWFSVAETKPRQFAVALARAASKELDKFFGERLFSKRSFSRSAAISTGLLTASLLLSALFGVGIEPWKEFQRTADSFRSYAERSERRSSELTQDEVRELNEIVAVVVSHTGWQWKAVYCIAFFTVFAGANCLSFLLTTALSRLVLREIVASGRLFSAAALLTLNLFLVVCVGTAFLLFASLLAYPALWILVPLAFLLSSSSLAWLFAFLFGGGILAWTFGNPCLQIVSTISALPFFGCILICGVSLVAMADRKRFHGLCAWILLRCTGKRPLSFIVGFLVLVGGLITLLIRALG